MKRVFDRSGERAAEEVLRGEERHGERDGCFFRFPAGDRFAGTLFEKRLFVDALERLFQRARAQAQTVAYGVSEADHHARAPEQRRDPPRGFEHASFALEEESNQFAADAVEAARRVVYRSRDAAREVDRDGVEVVQHVEARVLVIQ